MRANDDDSSILNYDNYRMGKQNDEGKYSTYKPCMHVDTKVDII